jgi:hypothetical protein
MIAAARHDLFKDRDRLTEDALRARQVVAVAEDAADSNRCNRAVHLNTDVARRGGGEAFEQLNRLLIRGFRIARAAGFEQCLS